MAVGDFPEGATATHKDGRKIVFKNGEWHVAPGSAAKPNSGGKTTEGERKASAFLTRALGANTAYEKQQIGPRSLVGQTFRDTFPNASNYISSDQQQVADTAQDEFIAASLRQDSGAAIPEEEMERQRRIYFPMPGDGEVAIKAKAAARQRAMQGLVASAGNGVDPKLREEYPSFFNQEGGDQTSGAAGATGGSGTPPAGPTAPRGPDSRGDVAFSDEGPQLAAGVSRLSPEAQENLHRFLLTKPSAQAIKTLYDTLGAGVLPEANAQQIAEYYAKGGTERIGVNYDNARAELTDAEKAEVAGFVNQSDTVGAGVAGIGEGATLSALDEIGSVAEAAFGSGQGSFGERLDRRLLVNRAKLSGLEAESPIAYGAGQIVGSLPLGGAEFAGARAAAAAAGKSAVRANIPAAEARLIANRVFANRTALEAAGFGGVQGFADAEGDIGDRLVGGGIGAVAGGAGGYGLARGGSRFARAMAARRGNAGPTPAQLFGAAAERRNVSYLPADVPDATAARMASGLSNVTFGAIPLSEAATKSVASAKAAKSAVADSIGVAGDATRAGQAIQRGASTMIDATQGRASMLYDAIPIERSANASVGNTRAALADLTAGLTSNPKLSKLMEDPRLKAYADALTPNENVVGPLPRRGVAPAFLGENGKVYAGKIGTQHFSAASPEARAAGVKGVGFVDKDGRFLSRQDALTYVRRNGEDIKPSSNMGDELDALDYSEQSAFSNDAPAVPSGQLSWQDLKSFRTYIGEKLGGPQLQSDTPRKALKALYSALSADMEATAAASGPKALNAFKRANTYYRAREGRIENVLSAVLGKDLNKSPDAAFRAVESMANKRTGDPLKLARLIRSLPDDEANAVRATILDKLGLASAGRQDGSQEVYSPAEFMTQWSKLSERAKSVLFGGEHKEAVNDLVRIAEGMKSSTQFANTSRTTLGTNALATAATLWANPLAGILAVGGQFGAGKLLSSQRVARWLTRAPKKPNVQAQRAHVASLSSIARAEPAIAADVLSLQQRLFDTFGSAPARLAANKRDDHASVADRQESNGATANQRLQP